MKEFDKIYVAKYYEVIDKGQICKDFYIKVDELEYIVTNLKQTGLYDIYKKISDEEWEKLEKKKDSYILKIYMSKIPRNYPKIFNEIVEELREEIPCYRYLFEMYRPEDYKFEFDYFQNKNFEGEEWKKIPQFDYSLSNYGRLKNDKTGKLKALRHHRWIIQADIYKDSKRYTIDIPRLEASLFIRRLQEDEKVSFIDGNKENRYYKNLRIVNK